MNSEIEWRANYACTWDGMGTDLAIVLIVCDAQLYDLVVEQSIGASIFFPVIIACTWQDGVTSTAMRSGMAWMHVWVGG